MNTPRISVIIDTYNHERFIAKAVESVLAQDFPSEQMEVVAVDDGSTDGTLEVLRRFESKVRLIRKTNGGQASALNTGIAETTGEIVAFCDGDDWWDRAKLAMVSQAFQASSNIAAVGHSYYEETCFVDISSKARAQIANHARTFLGTSKLAVRRRALESIGAIPDAFRLCADAPILSLALALGGATILASPLCYYRIHSDNLFAGVDHNPSATLRKAEILARVGEFVGERLVKMEVPEEIRTVVVEAYQLEADRLRLFANGKAGRAAVDLESQHSRIPGQPTGTLYELFKAISGGLSSMLPAERYYGLRRWYAGSGLKRLRQRVAPAETPVWEQMFVRRPVAPSDGLK
jgi:hypothetical protein